MHIYRYLYRFFAQCSVSDYAYEQALVTVKALALTGFDVLTDDLLRKEMKKEMLNKGVIFP